MKVKPVLLTSAAVVVVAGVVFAVMALTGSPRSLFGHQYAFPACDKLPNRAEVTRAIAQHSSLVGRLSRAGDDVQVVAGSPCPDAGKSVVTVQVSTDAEEDTVNDVLTKSTGFGAPATIDRQ